jgi:hypothetical protein
MQLEDNRVTAGSPWRLCHIKGINSESMTKAGITY